MSSKRYKYCARDARKKNNTKNKKANGRKKNLGNRKNNRSFG